MISIQPLTDISLDAYRNLVVGYTSQETYVPTKSDMGNTVAITLKRTPLGGPLVKICPFDEETYRTNLEYLKQGVSFGATYEGRLIGLIVAGKRKWIVRWSSGAFTRRRPTNTEVPVGG